MSTVEVKDQRRYERTAFFLVPTGREPERVWVFKPQDELDARAGLVLEMSDGGLRLLVEAEEALADGRYHLRLLPIEMQGIDPADLKCELRLVWSRTEGQLGHYAGFEFEGDASRIVAYLRAQALSIEQRSWMRCLVKAQK
jgi:hypothetical protein